MVPKPLQNRSWRGSGGLLGATLEARCFQDLIFDDFGSILGHPLGPVWAHFGHHFFDVFLKWLFDGLGLHLGSQSTSKMRPKRGSKSKHEKSSILLLFTTLWRHSGVLNMVSFSCFFGTPFWDGFWIPFWWFWLTFGVPFGYHFGHLLGTIFASFFRPPKNIKKREVSSAPSWVERTLSPREKYFSRRDGTFPDGMVLFPTPR